MYVRLSITNNTIKLEGDDGNSSIEKVIVHFKFTCEHSELHDTIIHIQLKYSIFIKLLK